MLKKLNAAMDYIEAHLEEDFRLEEVAAGVGISDLSFRQLFYALTGMTLQEYVKNRRLSEASGALLRGCSVTGTAYRYGYQSVDGFTRAFRRWSGLLPSEAARTRQGRTLQRLNFIVTVQGGDTMEYRIVEKPAFRFAGVSRRVPMQFEGVNEAIVRLAESITPRAAGGTAPPAGHCPGRDCECLLGFGQRIPGGAGRAHPHDRGAHQPCRHRRRTGQQGDAGIALGGVPL